MNRRYEEDDSSSPIDRFGVLKDGRKATVGMMMRDQRDARVTDVGLHRPGFRLDTGLRDERQEARDAYERELTSAWRTGDKKVTQRDPEGRLMSTLEEEEEDVTDAMPTRKGMTTDEIARDHQRNMSNIYQAYDTSLCDAWRRKP
jgi:hypothetical protein